MQTVTQTLDLPTEKCPMPILKAKRALSKMAQGEVLHVISIDKASIADLAEFCRQTGHTLLEQHEDQVNERYETWIASRG